MSTLGTTESFRYIRPDVPDGNIRKTVQTQILLSSDTLFNTLYTVIETMTANTDEVNSGTNPDKFRWSYYEQLGIPPYSYIEDKYTIRLRKIFKQFNFRGLIRSLFRGNPGNGILDNYFGGSKDSAKFEMFESQPMNVFLTINPNKSKLNTYNSKFNYKIHICVKEEYAMYTLLKVMKYIMNTIPDKMITSKFILSQRKSHFLKTNTIFTNISWDGGFLQTLVIYMNDDPNLVRNILMGIIDLFPEEEVIGNMPLTGTEILPFANIRLNHMLCYAQGDRQSKVKTLQRTKLGNYNTPIEERVIPEWIRRMKEECATSRDTINKKCELFFGLPLCDREQLYEARCVEAFCYISDQKDFLDPNTITNNKYLTAIGGKRRATRKQRTLRNKKSRVKR